MFAKLEKLRTIEPIDRGRSERAATTAPACNDNHRIYSSAAAAQRLRRSVLGCRWIKGSSGALECVWQVEGVEESAAEGPLRKWCVRQSMPLAAA
jgi:hypothetical protein